MNLELSTVESIEFTFLSVRFFSILYRLNLIILFWCLSHTWFRADFVRRGFDGIGTSRKLVELWSLLRSRGFEDSWR